MTFLGAIFLFALPLAAVPVVIHLLHRRRQDVVRWGAMQFLLEAVSRGEFQVSGFRNRDLRPLLFEESAPSKSLSAKVTRLLRLLRAHGVITKIEKSHRYQLTREGVSQLSAVLAAHRADTATLLQAA